MRSPSLHKIVIQSCTFQERFQPFFFDGRSADRVNHPYLSNGIARFPIPQNFPNRFFARNFKPAWQRRQTTVGYADYADTTVLKEPRSFSGTLVGSVPEDGVHLAVHDSLQKKVRTGFLLFIKKPRCDEPAATQLASRAHKKHSEFLAG